MPDTQPREPNVLHGIALKVASVCVFTAMSALIKATSAHVPAGEAVFFRSFFAMPLILAWLAYNGQLRRGLYTQNPISHFWRGLVGVTAMFLGFTALGLLPLPEVVTIGYAAPLFATILAAMFLGERIRLYRLTAVFAGLAGVILVLSPRLTVLQSGGADAVMAAGALFALMGALFAALAQVFVRKLVTQEATATIVVYFSLLATLLSLTTLPFGWVWPEPREAALLILAGMLGGLGQILLTESYRHAETSVIASFEYTSMLLALGVGYFVFAEAPTTTMLAGAAIVVVSGLAILYRERQLGIERAKARKVITPQG
jgi:drug/metabolite transporter (DMT)-like permease